MYPWDQHHKKQNYKKVIGNHYDIALGLQTGSGKTLVRKVTPRKRFSKQLRVRWHWRHPDNPPPMPELDCIVPHATLCPLNAQSAVDSGSTFVNTTKSASTSLSDRATLSQIPIHFVEECPVTIIESIIHSLICLNPNLQALQSIN